MNTSNSMSFSNRLRSTGLQRGLVFGAIIIFALLAFEIFNFSTTQFALQDLLGDLSFFGLSWATVLAIAFCGIDFAGIARLFTPEQGADEPKEIWYLFGAWLLAATMNAMLTWWGVSIALLNHQSSGTAVMDSPTLLKVVPVFVAVMVWLIRVLIIGTFSVAGERLFSLDSSGRSAARPAARTPTYQPQPRPVAAAPRVVAPPPPAPVTNFRPASTISPAPKNNPAPKPASQHDGSYNRPEPTYVPMSASGRNPAPAPKPVSYNDDNRQ